MTETVRTARGVNVTLLGEVLNFITNHPDIHNQDVWLEHASTDPDVTVEPVVRSPESITPEDYLSISCGTAGCLAGWTAIASGYTPAWPKNPINWCQPGDLIQTENVKPLPGATPIPGVSDGVAYGYGGSYDVRDVAVALLGITDDEADVMFTGTNTIRDLWEFAALVTDGALTVPIELADAETVYDGDHRGILADTDDYYRKAV